MKEVSNILNKEHATDSRKETKLCLFVGDMMAYIDNPKESGKKLTDNSKINTQKSVFLYSSTKMQKGNNRQVSPIPENQSTKVHSRPISKQFQKLF